MDLQLTSIAADQTRPYTIHGLRINGHPKDVTLIVRWARGCEAYQRALDAQAFRKLGRDTPEWREALTKLIAQHLVTGWEDVPEGLAYTPARGAQVLDTFTRDKREDRWVRFLAFIAEGDNFQAELVDAEDLGNG